ncbi:MAG: aspartate aminotransferase family protein [Hyphomicrobiaceae bacterium]
MTKLINRTFNHDYPTVAGGKGVRLIDTNGKSYLDASGGAAVSSIGHGHPKVVAAIKQQVDEIAYAHTAFFTSKPAEALADWLIARAPEGFGRVAFVSGGSEAIEGALKLTRQVHVERGDLQRRHFIARHQSYHGGTLGTIALAGPKPTRSVFEPVFGDGMSMSHIAPCYAYRHRRDDESEVDYGLRVARALEEEILRVGPQNVAGFVAETVSGSSIGCAPPTPGYFKEIRRICDKYGVFLIVDEVMSGMGRTGHLFAIAEDGVSPDLVAIAKGLGGGYQPIGAVLLRSAHYEHLAKGSGTLKWTHTYLAHPMACAAALAVQQVIEEENLLANCRARGAELKARLQERLGQHPHVGDIRGRGLFVGIELVADRTTKAPFPRAHKVAETFKKHAFANGMLCYPSGGTADGVIGDHVMLAPPLIITSGEINELVDIVERTLADTMAGLDRAGKGS